MRKIRIGIDARLIAQTGVGRYIHELINELSKNVHYHKNIELYVYVRPQDTHLIPHDHQSIIIRNCTYRWHSWGEQIGLYLQLMKDKLDLVHFTYFSFPLLYRRPYVITLHDLTPLTHQTGTASTKHPLIYKIKSYAYQLLIRVAARQSNAIITPSNTVAQQVVHLLRVPSGKIHVTYEGLSTSLLHAKPAKQSPYPFPYFLYVGNMYPHKNVQLILRALTAMPKDIHLVCIGAHDHFTQSIQALAHELQLSDQVVMAGRVSDSDLATTYTHCIALIHPSYAEGFGLTPLEALYFKRPVIASRLPIFHEILGESFTPIDPTSVDSLIHAMRHPLPPTMSPAHIRSHFSFSTMAESTWKLYMSLLKQ